MYPGQYKIMITRKNYLDSIENFNTRDLTRKALIYWDGYLTINNLDEEQYILKLKEMGQDPNFYLNLNQFTQHLINNGIHPRTIRAYFSAVKQYLRGQGLRIYNEDVKQFVKFPKILKETRIPLDHKTIQILLDNASNYMKLVILALVSSGMRVSELLQLTYKDLKEPYVNLRAETTKTGVERKTFFSKQVWPILNHFLKNLEDSADYVFCSNYEPKVSLDELESKFALLRNKARLSKKYNNSNVNTITIHRFRAFCKTQASEVCGKDFAEGLIGHEGYLGGYYGLPDDEKLKNYLKIESRLIFRI